VFVTILQRAELVPCPALAGPGPDGTPEENRNLWRTMRRSDTDSTYDSHGATIWKTQVRGKGGAPAVLAAPSPPTNGSPGQAGSPWHRILQRISSEVIKKTINGDSPIPSAGTIDDHDFILHFDHKLYRD